MQKQRLIWSLLVLFSLSHGASAINCYYCNSANNSACLDVNLYDPETRVRLIPVVHCETAIPSPVAVNFFCRKIVQTIFATDRDHEVRVTRGCGWVLHDKPCYNANNADHLERVCQCFDDHCNAGIRQQVSLYAALFVVMAYAFRFGY